THLREAFGGAVHPLDHVMAADARVGAHALGHDRRGIVRAAGAEVWGSQENLGLDRPVALELLQFGYLRLQSLAADVLADKPLTDGNGDVGRLERALGREEPLLVFILLADDPRTIRRVEELLFDLSLNERPLFLDDDDRLKTIGKSSNT